jgi:hypothetical protein
MLLRRVVYIHSCLCKDGLTESFPVLLDRTASKINAEASPRMPATRGASKRDHNEEFDLSDTEILDPPYTGEFDQETA